jgi:hypothetical protein
MRGAFGIDYADVRGHSSEPPMFLVHLTRALVIILCTLIAQEPVSAQIKAEGYFKGKPITEWDPGGRLMRLVQPFGYVDPTGIEWSVPPQFATDGASIPQFAWSFIGGPFEGKFRLAAIVHDLYCVTRNRPTAQVHRVFYDASLAAGESKGRAWVMYQAILRFGPKWDSPTPRPASCDKFENVSQKECAVSSSDNKILAIQPTNEEIRNFIEDIKKDGYPNEAQQLERALGD